MAPAGARYAALREMGGDRAAERGVPRRARPRAARQRSPGRPAYALRALRKSPGFSAVAILSLALGIGANTTIFTFVNAVLLRPLPYPGSDRLVVLREQPLGADGTVNVHPVNFVEWRARARSFEALALVQTPPLNVIGSNGAEQIARIQTTSELFRVFGVAPALGRVFTEEETRPGGDDVVILGYGFWQRWFGGDPGVARTTAGGPGRVAHDRRRRASGTSHRRDGARRLHPVGHRSGEPRRHRVALVPVLRPAEAGRQPRRPPGPR